MKIYKEDSTGVGPPIVASIGFFDGVHQGHQFLLQQVCEEAKKRSLPSAIITFVEHPRQVLQADFQPALLCGYEEKVWRVGETKLVDCFIPIHFTPELSRFSACEFMRYVLKEKYNVDTLVIGYDHRFGHNRTDDFAQYVKYGEVIGINVVRAKELDSGEYVSSSRIRNLLTDGGVEEAAKLLTYNYTISGKIVEGFKVGRTIGYPTANIELWERFKVIPSHGVYAVHVHMDGRRYGGMLYIGRRPTVQNSENVTVEVNIFDFHDDLYGKELTVEFIKFVRRDVKFVSLEILKRQLQVDEQTVKKILSVEQ